MTAINVNGTTYQVADDPSTPLLWILRDTLGLTGTKFGCGVSQCGACTVLLNGEAVRSCEVSLAESASGTVTTIEAMAATALGARIQAAWIKEQVPQCGYCQPGMIMAVVDLIQRQPGSPSDASINSAITNICACGTFERIRKAIHLAAG